MTLREKNNNDGDNEDDAKKRKRTMRMRRGTARRVRKKDRHGREGRDQQETCSTLK